jgi:hypothetical protein
MEKTRKDCYKLQNIMDNITTIKHEYRSYFFMYGIECEQNTISDIKQFQNIDTINNNVPHKIFFEEDLATKKELFFFLNYLVAKTLNVSKDDMTIFSSGNSDHDLKYNDKKIKIKYSKKHISNKTNSPRWVVKFKQYEDPDEYLVVGLDENHKNIEKIWMFPVNAYFLKNRKYKNLDSKKFKSYELDAIPFIQNHEKILVPTSMKY